VSEYYEAVEVVAREDLPAFARLYFGDGSGVWLATSAGNVVGCIALKPIDRFPASAEVKRLYVKPAWRGHGVAAMLLEALHAYAAASAYEWLYLDTKDDLKTAIRFYEKHGYGPCERYNDNPQATVFMRKQLAKAFSAPPRE
jgi:GNAT superfamily N-acetyltransferase